MKLELRRRTLLHTEAMADQAIATQRRHTLFQIVAAVQLLMRSSSSYPHTDP